MVRKRVLLVSVSSTRSLLFIGAIVGLILFSSFHTRTSAIDIDDFPVGLRLIYESWTEIFNGPASGDSFFYEFTRWDDEGMNLIEYTSMTPSGIESRIDVVHNIWLDFPGKPYLLVYTDFLIIGESYKISGTDYDIVNQSVVSFSEIEVECFQLVNVVTTDGFENTTSLFYDSEYGILIARVRLMVNVGSGTDVVFSTIWLTQSNFEELNQSQFPFFRSVLVVMIAIEVVTIAILLKRRWK